jgi:hypothetical protein
VNALRLALRRGAHALIRLYQVSLSGLIGRECRYLPTCSAYTDGRRTDLPLPSLGSVGLRSAACEHPRGRLLGPALALRALAIRVRVSAAPSSPVNHGVISCQ